MVTHYIAAMDIAASPVEGFISALETATADGSLVRLEMRAYRGRDSSVKSLDIKPAMIRKRLQLSFVWHHKSRDLTSNRDPAEVTEEIRRLIGPEFGFARLLTTDGDVTLDLSGKSARLKRSAATQSTAPSLAHDRDKYRPVAADRPWLHELGLTDRNGRILSSAQDKYRQINRYVEILTPLLAGVAADRLTRVVDMGAGKGYLTFAVADHLAQTRGDVSVVGVEMRPDLVALCNKVAHRAGLSGLSFVEGSIQNHDATGAAALIALHACDTATDDAIAKGIAAGAELIVVAPCCHKQIRREVEAARARSPLDYVMRHGIFVERQCEMVTDGIRALILEYFGYRTKVFEFIADQHTPKNVMIVGERWGKRRDPAILQKIEEAKAFFGIRQHYLEAATGLATFDGVSQGPVAVDG